MKSVSDTRTGETAHALGQRIVEEVRRFSVMFLYLWVLFGLFVLNERIILRQHGIGFSSQGFALINALVLAKVMLVAEDLDLGHWLRGRPLIYPIMHESSAVAILFICFHVAEHAVKDGSTADPLPRACQPSAAAASPAFSA